MLTEEQKAKLDALKGGSYMRKAKDRCEALLNDGETIWDIPENHPGRCVSGGRAQYRFISQWFLDALDIGGIEAVNYVDDLRHGSCQLEEKHFPNYKFGQNKVVSGVKFSLPDLKYTMCQSAPEGGVRCHKCNQHNPHAGPNLGDKYVCYQCR